MKHPGRWLLNLAAVCSFLLGYVTFSLGEAPIDMVGLNIPIGSSRLHVRVNGMYIWTFWTGPYDRPWAQEIWGTSTSTTDKGFVGFPIWPGLLVMMGWPIYLWRDRLSRIGSRKRVPQPRQFGAALLFSHMIASYAFFAIWQALIPAMFPETAYSDMQLVGDRLAEAPARTLSWLPRVAMLMLSDNLPGWRMAEYAIAAIGYALAFVLTFWLAYFRLTRRTARTLAGLCPTCGYDLRATPDRCPECGEIRP